VTGPAAGPLGEPGGGMCCGYNNGMRDGAIESATVPRAPRRLPARASRARLGA